MCPEGYSAASGEGRTSAQYSRYGFRTPVLTEPLLEPDRLPGGNSIAQVKLISLENLDSPSLNGTPHAFVEFRLVPAHPTAGDQVQRSEIKASRSNPKWVPPAKFKFVISNTVSSKIVVSVYHFNSIGPIGAMGVGPPIPLGDTVLHLKGDPSSSHFKSLSLQTDVGTTPGIAHFEYSFRTPDEESRSQEDAVYEFQRWQPGVAWGHGNGFFFPTDPGRWASLDGGKFGAQIDEVASPVMPGWTAGPWQLTGNDEDPDGWEYAVDFFAPCWFGKPEKSSLFVRRRQMSRIVTPDAARPPLHSGNSSNQANPLV